MVLVSRNTPPAKLPWQEQRIRALFRIHFGKLDLKTQFLRNCLDIL